MTGGSAPTASGTPANPDTIEAIRAAMGEPVEPPVWVVRPGASDALDGAVPTPPGGRPRPRRVDRLPADLPLGIHDLEPLDGGPSTTLLVGPGRCHLPDGLAGVGRHRPGADAPGRRASWGIGDLADVRRLGAWIAGLGGGALGLSPLHAPTPVAPIPASPYYPSSRRWRSPLLIRVDEVGPATAGPGPRRRRPSASCGTRSCARDAAGRSSSPPSSTSGRDRPARERRDADHGVPTQGAELERWATFCALAEIHGPRWRQWPAELRRPERRQPSRRRRPSWRTGWPSTPGSSSSCRCS